ncbi:MAG: GGDEF domain-containing protein [Sandaracinus sp.]|nr:GGDEF domain-containing protein [Sandaracinus sp.]MCB9613784.1 GGDEF domain-containing protein [Sandaracinus sp.]MCB9619886.1 GGDEF domain-containing protein [Sandaracinus sp.]MCB9625272.1 GGDEF domain-containing protein [Sandaracinus sp.]
MEIDAELLAAVVDQAPDALLLVDDEGWVAFANRAACTLLGYDLAELVGAPVEKLMPERFRATHVGHRTRFMQAPRARAMGIGGRLPVRRADGTEVVAEVSLGPVQQNGNHGVVVALRDVTERVREEDRLRYLSTHDALTELYNRAFFEAEKSRLESGRVAPISVVVVDVDDLKVVNDRYGHAAGDQHLRALAAVLRRAFRADDVVARLGGDEFVVLLPRVDVMERDEIVERFLDELRRQNEIAARPVKVSVGTATARRSGALSTALRVADERMYKAKSSLRRVSQRALG